MSVAERMAGRKEHDPRLKATEYINKSFDDVWAAIIRLHVMALAVMFILGRRKG